MMLTAANHDLRGNDDACMDIIHISSRWSNSFKEPG
jgi:hypothetical protein